MVVRTPESRLLSNLRRTVPSRRNRPSRSYVNGLTPRRRLPLTLTETSDLRVNRSRRKKKEEEEDEVCQGRYLTRPFIVDSGSARRVEHFNVYQHWVSEACMWDKIGVEKVRPPCLPKTATPPHTVLWGFAPLTNSCAT